jgi:hypothetical protein
MPHHVKVKPVRVHSYNAELHCHTSRIVAYRAVCSCEWKGSQRSTVTAALIDARAHPQPFNKA